MYCFSFREKTSRYHEVLPIKRCRRCGNWHHSQRTDHGVQVNPTVCVNPREPPHHRGSLENGRLLDGLGFPFPSFRQGVCVKNPSISLLSCGGTPRLEGSLVTYPRCALTEVRVFPGAPCLFLANSLHEIIPNNRVVAGTERGTDTSGCLKSKGG